MNKKNLSRLSGENGVPQLSTLLVGVCTCSINLENLLVVLPKIKQLCTHRAISFLEIHTNVHQKIGTEHS